MVELSTIKLQDIVNTILKIISQQEITKTKPDLMSHIFVKQIKDLHSREIILK